MESLYARIFCEGWYRDSGTCEVTCVKTNDIKPMIINGVVEGEDQWDEICNSKSDKVPEIVQRLA
jgi:hypothetical protein